MAPVARSYATMTDRTGPGVASALRNMRRFANEAFTSGRSVERSTSRMHAGLSRLTRFMGQQISGTIRSFFYGMRMAMVGAGVAVTAFVGTSLKSFRDFDKKLRETTSLIAGSGQGGLKNSFKEAEKAYKDFYKTILQLAPQMRRTPQELASGLYEIVQAGITQPAAAKRLLKPAAMGATAGGGTVDSSARVLVQVMNALKMGTTKPGAGKQAQAVMDRIFQAINLGVGVDFGSLSQGIGKFIGGAGVTFKGGRKGGLKSLDELMATYIFATQQGARTADVGVGIQDVIKTIANPSVKSAKFAKSIGLQTGSSFLNQHGFVGSLTTIIAKMKEAGYTGSKLNDAIGKFFADVRGRRIVQYAANLDMVKQAMKGMGQATDSTSRAFKEQGKSLDAAMMTFKSYWETLKVSLGSSTAPYVISAMDRITGVLGDSGAIGAGQDLLGNAPARGAKRKAYFAKLNDQQMVQVQQAQRFNRQGIGGKIQQIGQQALIAFRAWWNTPQTQSAFQNALHSMVQRSFDMLGRAIHTLPSIYKFGLRIGGEILRGAVDGMKSGLKGMLGGGGGGLGGSNPLGGMSSDPYQAITGVLFGAGLAKSGWNKSPAMRGGGLAGGALLAGANPLTAAVLGAGGFITGMRNKRAAQRAEAGLGGGTAGAAGVASMMVNAANVTINARGGVFGGGGGGGGIPMGGPGGPTLRPGYTTGVDKRGRPYFRGPKGFVSKMEAYGAATGWPVMGPIGAPGTGGAAPRGGFLGGLRGVGRGLGFGGGLKGMGAGGYASLGLAALSMAPELMGAAQGKKTNWTQLAGTGLTSVGGALSFIAPEFGLPLLGAGLGLNYLAGRSGGKGHGAAPMSPYQILLAQNKLIAPQGTPTTVVDTNYPKMPSKGHGGRGAAANPLHYRTIIKPNQNVTSGLGGKFGIGGGFDMKKAFALNSKLAGISGKYFHSAKAYYSNLNALMATPFGDDDKAAKYYERAYTYGQTSQQAMDLLDQVAQEWHNQSLEQAAGRAEQSKMNKHLKQHMKKGKLDAVTANKMMDRGLFRQVASMTVLSPDQKKKFEDQGSVPLNRFGFGWDRESRVLKNSAPQKVQALIDAYTNAITSAAGGSGGQGPSTAPPPGGGSSSRFNNGRQTSINVSGAAGSNPSGALGEQMASAGSQMADRVSENIANSLVKKAMQGPAGKAQRGLHWLYQQIGKPYIWGGGHPPGLNLKGYDCSGLASSALMAMGSGLAGTTTTMLPNTAPGHGMVTLGFNDPKNPSHMGISVLGQWFEARGHATPILGPGKARTQWPYYGTPKFHSGGVYHSGSVSGEGPAILKDGELVVRPTNDGGLQAHPVDGGVGGVVVHGPLIGHAVVRNEHDVHRIAEELVDLLEKKKQNSGKARR